MVDEANTNSEDLLRDLTIDDTGSAPDLTGSAPDNDLVAEVEPVESLPIEGPDNLELSEDPLLELTPDQKANQVATDFELGIQQDMLKATDDLASAKDNFFDADLYKYDRYAAYGEGILNSVGFNPYLDNEANFNASTNIIDDWFRAQAPTFDNMLLGFTSSLPGGTTGVVSPEHAKRMAKNSEIAHSDRGGLGSFGINLYHNAGFTIGIMAEMAAEELVMTGVTALTAGATGGVQAARTAYLATKLGKALSGGLKVANKLDNLKDVSKARSFFNKAINFVNPLDEVTKLKNASNKLDGLGKLAVTSKYFGAFYRDTRNIRMAFSESSLEGGMVRNSKREEYLQDWYSKNPGGKISDEELAEIDKLAMDAGRTASFINMPTIFFSNKLVFDNMFKSFSPAGRLMDDVVETGVRGEVSFAKKTAKQLAKGEKAYERVASGFKRRLNNIKNPADWLKRSGTYFKANFAEGLQEIAQETIASGVEEHYQNIYEGDALKGGLLVSLANGLQKQASAQGLETFASGFLMGGLVQPVTMIPGKVRKNYKRVTAKGREEYAAQQKARDEYIDKTVEKLNDIYENNPSYFMNDLNDLVTQAKHARNINNANKTGDKKLLKDIQERSNFDAITAALKMGRMNSFKEQLNTYKEYSEAEIKEEFGMSKSDFLLGLDQAQQRMDKIQARYDLVQKEFVNPYNASKYKKGSPEFKEELNKQVGWESAQKELVFNGHAFDRSLERMTSIMRTAKDTAGLENMNAADFNTLFTSQDLDSTISTLQQTIDSYGDVSEPEAKKNKAKDQAKLDSLTDFRNKFEAFLDNVGLSKKEKSKVSAEEGAVAVKGKVKTDEQLYTEAYDSFKSYIELMSKSTGDFVFNNKLEEAFEGIVDYQRLDADAKKLSTSINILMKASNFEGLAERLNTKLKDQDNNRKFEMEKALKAWLKEVKDPSDLVNALDKAGIFLDPKYLKAIMDDGMSANDVQFYNLKTKELILPTDELYAEAIKIIFDKGGFLTDINISESEVPNSEVGYRLRNRIKDPADTRTYDQIATEYGFDSAADSKTLSLKDVLNKIINNDFASQEEIELAKQLLKLAKDGETITFVKNASQPGVFSEENQSVIDARYSSSEYDNGYLPFESSILHTEINRRVDESFDEDLEFRTAINEQWAAAKEAAVNSEEFPNIKTLVGNIKNAKEFMALAMTNSQFQLFLSTIESPVTKTSQWKNFVDNLMKVFADYFKLKGIEPTRTVLNTTIELITTKVDPVVYSGTGGTVSPMAPVTAESEIIPGDHDDVHDVAKKKAKGQDITKEEEELVAKYPVLYAKLVKVEQDRIETLEKARTERDEMTPEVTPESFESNLIGQKRGMVFITKEKDYPVSAEIKEAYVDENGNYVIIAEKTSGPDGRTSTQPGKIYNMEVNPETGDVISFTTPDGKKGGVKTLGDNFTGAKLKIKDTDYIRLKETDDLKAEKEKIEKRRQEELDNTGIDLSNEETSNFNQGLKEIRNDVVKKLFDKERRKAQVRLKQLANSTLSLKEISDIIKKEFGVSVSAGKAALNEITLNEINARYDAELDDLQPAQQKSQYKPSQNQKNFETIQERLDKGDNIEGAVLSPSEVRDEATANKHADTTMYVQIEGVGPLKAYFPEGAPESGAEASLSLELPVAGEENVIEDEDGNLVFQYQADGPMFPAVIKITTKDGKTGQLAYTNFSTEAPDFADIAEDINEEFDKKAQDIINSIPKRSDTSSGKPTYTLNSILNDLGSVKSTLFLTFIYDNILMSSNRDEYKSLKTIQTKEGETVDLSLGEFKLQVQEKNPKYVGPESSLSKLIQDSYSSSRLSTILEQMNIEAAKQAADTASGTTPVNVFDTYENKINTPTLSVEGLEELKEKIRKEDNLTPEEQNLLIEQINNKIKDLKNSNIPTETELRNLAVGTLIAISTPKTGNQFVSATVIETKPNSFIAETTEGEVKHTIKFSEVNKVNLDPMNPLDSSVMKDTEEDSNNSVGDIDETVIEDAIKRASDDTDATNQDLDEGLADYLNNCLKK